jgi:hypothetical protein
MWATMGPDYRYCAISHAAGGERKVAPAGVGRKSLRGQNVSVGYSPPMAPGVGAITMVDVGTALLMVWR